MSGPCANVIATELDDLLAQVRNLRARGATPKMIAKDLGITRAEADAMIRRIARESTEA
jgi:transcriptional regulator